MGRGAPNTFFHLSEAAAKNTVYVEGRQLLRTLTVLSLVGFLHTTKPL